MNEVKPDDIRFGHVIRASRMEYDARPERFDHMAEQRMREAIAAFIVDARIETSVDEHFAEKRIDVYVATPKQFWALVHKEAHEIALRYAPR